MKRIVARPLTREAFAPFGEVIEMDGARHYPINAGMTERYHDLATVEALGDNARVLVNLFRAQAYPVPAPLRLVERHPLGSQAFIPLGNRPFLIVVCAGDREPGEPQAFVSRPGQGVSYPAGRWHGVLTQFGRAQDFLVIDRGGDGLNIEEHVFTQAYSIHLPETAGPETARPETTGPETAEYD